MTPRILIIADDLTGAADCGVACAAGAVVFLGKPHGRVPDVAILAVDADTRGMAPEQAAETIAGLVRSYDVSPPNERVFLFKKVDSTLRGNVAAELASALNARRGLASPAERVVALFAPASPDHGRTTVCGRQMVHGVPLEQTDVWRGENSRSRSNIAEILSEAGLKCGMIERALVRGGARALEDTMIQRAEEVDVLVCDAETVTDLQAIASAGMVLHPKTVWAGSAGLARQIPRAAGFASVPAYNHEDIAARVSGPTLFVVGSPATATREQARALAEASDVVTFNVSHSAMLSGERSSEWRDSARLISGNLQRGVDVLLQLDSTGRCGAEQAQLLTGSLARMIQPCANHVGALVATGGETARAVLDAWGVQRLRLLGEVEPGLPYSVTQGWRRTIAVLTKAGSFGTTGTLLACRDFLRRFPPAPATLGTGSRRVDEPES